MWGAFLDVPYYVKQTKVYKRYKQMKPTITLFKLDDHPLFAEISRTKARGQYVIVDPMDPDGLLYLTKADYLVMVRNAMANNQTLEVLLRPGESPDKPSDDDLTGHGGRTLRPRPSGSFLPAIPGSSVPDRGSGSQSYSTSLHNPRLNTESFNSMLSQAQLAVSQVETGGLTEVKFRALILKWGYILAQRLGYSPMAPSLRTSLAAVADHLSLIFMKEGPMAAVIRMKIAVYCVNSYLAGSRLTCTRHLGSPVALRAGLPSFLPLVVRDQIRQRNVSAIRLWVSLLSLYKGITGLSTVANYSTISSPIPELPPHPKEFDRSFWNWFNPESKEISWGNKGLLHLRSAGVNHPIAILSAAADAYAWSVETINHLEDFLIATKRTKLLDSYQTLRANFAGGLRKYLAISPSKRVRATANQTPGTGRLSLKYEAAGKVRVFAIVDIFTQSALQPLHDYLFNLLAKVDSDATFDQEGSVKAFAEKHRLNSIYSFDLSSATDLIPVELTERVLKYQIGGQAARWRNLIVGRSFLLPEGGEIRYTRGQPMGALSSWAALATTHHWLVQYAAWRIGQFPFTDYLILGDDVTIAGQPVADSYQEVCKAFSVPINNKGIVSLSSDQDSLTNFANQIILGTLNLSPIQIREEMSVQSMPARSEYLARLVRKGWLDYYSPSFLFDAFRFCASTPLQLKKGQRSFSQGFLPDAMVELMTFFSLPSDSFWGGTTEEPITYAFGRLLAGRSIFG